MKRGEIIFSESCSEGEQEGGGGGGRGGGGRSRDGSDSLLIPSEASLLRYPPVTLTLDQFLASDPKTPPLQPP